MGDSKGDFLAHSYRFISPSRSPSPTDGNCFFSRFLTGGYFLPHFDHGSYSFPSFSEGNYQFKPPWDSSYKSTTSRFKFNQPPSLSIRNSTKVTMSDRLRKSVQDLDLGFDDEPVSLPPEFCSQAAHVNRFSLVVTTVNPRKRNLRALIGQMPRVWGFPDSCVGRILDRGKVQFKFKTEEAMNLVLQRGPWSFNDWMLTIHRWYPNISEAEMKIIHFWVKIQGIPLLFLTNAMANYVGGKLGFVSDVDFDENSNHAGFVRVKIAWNIDNPLRFQRNFQFDSDENTLIRYRFERLRNFCTKCGSLKHDIKECALSFDDNGEEGSSDDDNDDHQDDNNDRDMSEADTLQTVDPATLIPGLQANLPVVKPNNSGESFEVSSLPSAFEDT